MSISKIIDRLRAKKENEYVIAQILIIEEKISAVEALTALGIYSTSGGIRRIQKKQNDLKLVKEMNKKRNIS